ncbi:MliC family protein [Hydromonas duriensis]|uniref:Membrane-bound lysozyme inhibitor of c-type lysozyme MliC n=1 Tax=Hydromonas duriensis TaxID=1527608 RepID=A0A4R6Y3M2_9BURK|nr:MliC family protein [Hydromonas duriensis]TDR31141.1 membrane-bound lysozyme inhibitor of c-type lysozyme MliC [Hydromonas duriensis]
MKKIVLIVSAFMLVCGVQVASAKTSTLTLSAGKAVHYQCDNGARVSGIYYNLSDNSLSFVKLTFNKEQYTLPSVVAASGVRYSDGRMLEWWEHAGEVLFNQEVNNSSSSAVVCKEVATHR